MYTAGTYPLEMLVQINRFIQQARTFAQSFTRFTIVFLYCILTPPKFYATLRSLIKWNIIPRVTIGGASTCNINDTCHFMVLFYGPIWWIMGK